MQVITDRYPDTPNFDRSKWKVLARLVHLFIGLTRWSTETRLHKSHSPDPRYWITQSWLNSLNHHLYNYTIYLLSSSDPGLCEIPGQSPKTPYVSAVSLTVFLLGEHNSSCLDFSREREQEESSLSPRQFARICELKMEVLSFAWQRERGKRGSIVRYW